MANLGSVSVCGLLKCIYIHIGLFTSFADSLPLDKKDRISTSNKETKPGGWSSSGNTQNAKGK